MVSRSLRSTYVFAITVAAVLFAGVALSQCAADGATSTTVYADIALPEWTTADSTPVALHVTGDDVDTWLTFTADDVATQNAAFDFGEGMFTVKVVPPLRYDGMTWNLEPATQSIAVSRHEEPPLQTVRVDGELVDDESLRDNVAATFLASGVSGGVKSDVRAYADICTTSQHAGCSTS